MKFLHFISQSILYLLLLMFFDRIDVRAAEPSLSLKEISINDGLDIRFLVFDDKGGRLYVGCPDKIVLFDSVKEAVVSEVGDIKGVGGFAISPRAGIGLVAVSGENKLRGTDLKDFHTSFSADSGKDPKAVIYAPDRDEVYVFNAGENTASYYEADDGDFEAKIKLPGKPGPAVIDTVANRIYCGIDDKNEVAVIDGKTRKVTEWPLTKAPTGLAVDESNHHLFVVCGDKTLLTLNSTNGQQIAAIPVGEGAAACACQSSTHTVCVLATDGTLTIAHEDAWGKLTVSQTLKVATGGGAVAIDSKTGKIFVGTKGKISIYGIGPVSNP